jgi:L-ascorbate metabolism protein UlaG (beta-lactamase superfamily)
MTGHLNNLGAKPVEPGQVELTWLGQSGFLLRFRHTRILVDPFLSPHPDRMVAAPYSLDALGEIDAIASTHEHWDHLDLAAVMMLTKLSPCATVIVPEPIVEKVVAAGVPAQRVQGLKPQQQTSFGEVAITGVAACHGRDVADAYNFGEGISAGAVRFLGYVFSDGEVVVYHAGDTLLYAALASNLRELGVKLALLPINGRDAGREAMGIVGNLTAVEAAGLAGEVMVDALVPMHYGMFATNPGSPGELVGAARDAAPATTVLVLSPFQPFVYTARTI